MPFKRCLFILEHKKLENNSKGFFFPHVFFFF